MLFSFPIFSLLADIVLSFFFNSPYEIFKVIYMVTSRIFFWSLSFEEHITWNGLRSLEVIEFLFFLGGSFWSLKETCRRNWFGIFIFKFIKISLLFIIIINGRRTEGILVSSTESILLLILGFFRLFLFIQLKVHEFIIITFSAIFRWGLFSIIFFVNSVIKGHLIPVEIIYFFSFQFFISDLLSLTCFFRSKNNISSSFSSTRFITS